MAETRSYLARYDAILKLWEDPEVLESEERTNALLAEQGEVQEILEHRDAMDPARLDAKIDQAMEALRLPPGDKNAGVLSGGEKRRVSLCTVLLAQPDLLILKVGCRAGLARFEIRPILPAEPIHLSAPRLEKGDQGFDIIQGTQP